MRYLVKDSYYELHNLNQLRKKYIYKNEVMLTLESINMTCNLKIEVINNENSKWFYIT